MYIRVVLNTILKGDHHMSLYLCDKLYNATDDVAKAMVASRTDRNN